MKLKLTVFYSSIPLSSQHEIQRYGKRAAGLDSSKRVNKAVFMNQIVQKQQEAAHYGAQMQERQHVEPVQEEQNQEQMEE